MITQPLTMEDEIVSLASSIKKNMVEPAGQRLEGLETRLAAAERSLLLLARAFFTAAVLFAATTGALVYYLARN